MYVCVYIYIYIEREREREVNYKELVPVFMETGNSKSAGWAGRLKSPKRADVQVESEGWLPAEFLLAHGRLVFSSSQDFNSLNDVAPNPIMESSLLTHSLVFLTTPSHRPFCIPFTFCKHLSWSWLFTWWGDPNLHS